MLMPRKVAHRKHHRGRMKGTAKGGTEVSFGDYGLQALECGWLTARQIEAARIAINRKVKRGRVLYEMEGVDSKIAREALRLAAHKLPVRTRFIEREG